MTTVDIAIPVLNEESYLHGCLDSVLGFDLPEGVSCTIYVLDGGSTDRTRAIAGEYSRRHESIVILDNPGKIQSCAMNIVILEGRGDYILRLDAHSFYPPDYLKLCLETAQRTGADNVGGVFITKPGGTGYQASLVQALTTHRFGVGNSEFRLNAKEGPADTVPYGFLRRSIFERIGLYDERLVRAQDYEINRRITSAGGKVWLNPKIKVYYHNQPTLVKFYTKQTLKEGPYNAYLWWAAPYAFAVRHAVTAAFVLGILCGAFMSLFSQLIFDAYAGVIALYCFLALFSAFQQATRYRQLRHVFFLPFCFFSYHFLHGIGVLWGLCRLGVGKAPVQKIAEPWPGAGRVRALPNLRIENLIVVD